MHLTIAINRAYSAHVTAKSVAGMAVLNEAVMSRQRYAERLFSCLSVLVVYGRTERGAARLAGASPVLPPVRFRPPRWQSGSGSFNELEAHIMTNTHLVPVFTGTIQNQSIQLCNARDLHQFLEVGKDFSNWIKNRIEQYGFIAGEDYSPILANRSDGKAGKRRTEYHLTLDMAKELAMVENNEKGRQIRRYFISLERQRSQGGTALPDQTIQEEELVKLIRKQIQETLPKSLPAPAQDHLLPPEQAKEISERLDRLSRVFHPFSDQFADVLGIMRALRGLHPKHGLEVAGFRKVVEYPGNRSSQPERWGKNSCL